METAVIVYGDWVPVTDGRFSISLPRDYFQALTPGEASTLYINASPKVADPRVRKTYWPLVAAQQLCSEVAQKRSVMHDPQDPTEQSESF